jgi:hypothetical protein
VLGEPDEFDELELFDESAVLEEEPELLAADPDLSELDLSEELLSSVFFSLPSPDLDDSGPPASFRA